MAKIQVRDYLDKRGFEDGDNVRLSRMAWRLRPFVVATVNTIARLQKWPYRALPCDVMTSHNECRMELYWEENGKSYCYDEYYGLMVERSAGSSPTHEACELSKTDVAQINELLARAQRVIEAL